jgi:hypothetical protein
VRHTGIRRTLDLVVGQVGGVCQNTFTADLEMGWGSFVPYSTRIAAWRTTLQGTPNFEDLRCECGQTGGTCQNAFTAIWEA